MSDCRNRYYSESESASKAKKLGQRTSRLSDKHYCRWPSIAIACASIAWAWTIAITIRFTGDEWWLGTIVLFSPRWLLLLPSCLALPLLWRIRLPVSALLVLALCVPVYYSLGFCTPLKGWATKRVIVYRILSCNVANWVGGSDRLVRLAYESRADVLLLQEYTDDTDLQIPDDWFVCHDGELLIASRYPIGDVASMMSRDRWPKVLGLFCQIQTLDGKIPIANVHFTSPRRGLSQVLDDRTLIAPSRKATIIRQTKKRELQSELLSKWALLPNGAMIVAGDFNMPIESQIFQRHWKEYRDAFSDVGFGLGHTVFVEAGGMIRYGARIDHVLTRGNWKAKRCWIGFDVGSDHLPLLADVYRSE